MAARHGGAGAQPAPEQVSAVSDQGVAIVGLVGRDDYSLTRPSSWTTLIESSQVTIVIH